MKFKLGDPVRVISHTSAFFDQVGRVTKIDKTGDRIPFGVTGLAKWSQVCFGPHELILAEKEDTP